MDRVVVRGGPLGYARKLLAALSAARPLEAITFERCSFLDADGWDDAVSARAIEFRRCSHPAAAMRRIVAGRPERLHLWGCTGDIVVPPRLQPGLLSLAVESMSADGDDDDVESCNALRASIAQCVALRELVVDVNCRVATAAAAIHALTQLKTRRVCSRDAPDVFGRPNEANEADDVSAFRAPTSVARRRAALAAEAELYAGLFVAELTAAGTLDVGRARSGELGKRAKWLHEAVEQSRDTHAA